MSKQSSYFAIKNLRTQLYWSGKKWGLLRDAREWKTERTAVRVAKIIGHEPGNQTLGVVQTV